ncbi:MAG: MaoC family dehydratase N-terminal domain-containing protein [Burkholderiales bacterium]|nr:MaoC family dehydratase N-terminal domain-containing protein [Burkholderiales bacterium]
MEGRGYADVAVGESFVETMRITDAHMSLGAALIGDFNPLHVDREFAGRSRHGGRILHGVVTSAIIGAPAGMIFRGTAIGYLEHNCRFLAPVRAGDVLTTTWEIVGKDDKPRHGGGVVRMQARCVNQAGVRVAEATGAMLVGNGPAA